jgi:phage RecT family recombinase
MRSFGMDVERIEKETSLALQILNDPKNSLLAKCTKGSILKSIVNIAQVGLTLNPISKEAYLIPRYSSYANCYECNLEPSYIGLVKLLTDAGSVTSIQTNLVYENDEFTIIHGLKTDFRHVPVLKGERGQIVGVYSVAVLKGGERQFEYVTREEIEIVRGHSESYKAWVKDSTKPCVWNEYEGEMFRKTCLKRTQKYLPRTNQMKYVDYAMDLTNKDYTPSAAQYNLAQQLIYTSTLIEPTKEQLEKEMPTCNVFQLNEMIEYLQQNQPNPIEDLETGSLAEINKQLDLKMAE